MKLKLQYARIILPMALTACATPIGSISGPTIAYDRDTEYVIDNRVDGFGLTVNYSRYQFIPESGAVATACRSMVISIAYEIAEKQGKQIEPVSEQRVRISMGRNGLTGITSCHALVAVNWKALPPNADAAEKKPEPVPTVPFEAYGTGFFVNGVGDLVTNWHVIEGCSTVAVIHRGAQKPATVRASDAAVDLAVLAVNTDPAIFPAVRVGRAGRLGEHVIVAGYPLQGLLGSGLNITTGIVSALAGLGNNSRVLQITAPVQPGNSGGPVLDESGAIVGVVVSKLNAAAVAQWTGDIPQNVNFAIKASILRGFLEANDIAYADAISIKKESVTDIAERAKAYTSPVLCRK